MYAHIKLSRGIQLTPSFWKSFRKTNAAILEIYDDTDFQSHILGNIELVLSEWSMNDNLKKWDKYTA